MNNLLKTVMNPVRLRIIQYIITNEKATTSEISKNIQDIPQATLYRHINTLVKNEIIEIVQENKIRGTVERVYSIKQTDSTNGIGNDELMKMATSFFMMLLAEFSEYTKEVNTDPVADMLFLQTATLCLSNSEYEECFKEIGEVIEKYLNKPMEEGRKLRRLSTISSPIK